MTANNSFNGKESNNSSTRQKRRTRHSSAVPGLGKKHSIASLLLDWNKLFESIVRESLLGGDMATTRRYLDLNSTLSSTLLDGDVSVTPININCLDPLGRTALLIGLPRWYCSSADRLSLSSHWIWKYRNDRTTAELQYRNVWGVALRHRRTICRG